MISQDFCIDDIRVPRLEYVQPGYAFYPSMIQFQSASSFSWHYHSTSSQLSYFVGVKGGQNVWNFKAGEVLIKFKRYATLDDI
ncbi:MAG TPA: hypothetical protein VFH04_01795 [Nitrososphaeraceae archaeon]|nr:hypothetical protein [Nitrososphaeraceae archaeon]